MALLNLTVNARDAMPQGGELRIAATVENVGNDHPSSLAPGTYVRLSVADTGKGMSEETLSRAIEPFFSTKGVGKGTGLGLSMAHGLAAQLSGGLTIESQLGVGTTVALWLPTSADAVEPFLPTEKERARTLIKGVALLVDDEYLVRMSTADMLTDLGYQVVEASTAEEALSIFKDSSSVDIVITDHLMPGMTGTDLIRHVRSIRPNVPVLMMSGYAQMEGIAADIPRLTKPFRGDELATALETIFALS
jgi:CheY-like chemotaxis protein